MPGEQPPFTEAQLQKLLRGQFGGLSGLVHNLARQLLAEKLLTRQLVRHRVTDRQRVIELEERMKPVGRVLMIDLPPFEAGRDFGCVEVYSDPGVRLAMASMPVGFHHPQFDELLERELKGLAFHWRGMPWELGPSYHTTWTRWKRAETDATETDGKTAAQHAGAGQGRSAGGAGPPRVPT